MADTKISALPAATTPLAGTEEIPIVQGGVTKKTTASELSGAATLQEVLTEDNDAGGLGIVNMLNPVLDQDAATKKYVDDNAGGAGLTADFVPKSDGSGGLVDSGIYDGGAIMIIDKKSIQINKDEVANGSYFEFMDNAGTTSNSNLAWFDNSRIQVGSDFGVFGYRMYLDDYESFFSENDTTLHIGNYAQNLNLRTGTAPDPSNLMINGVSGATGSFTSQDGKTITVTKGLITSIV